MSEEHCLTNKVFKNESESVRIIVYRKGFKRYELLSTQNVINNEHFEIVGFCIVPVGIIIRSTNKLVEQLNVISKRGGTYYLLEDWLHIKELERRAKISKLRGVSE